MFRSIKNKKAQAVIGEYVIVFSLIIGVLIAMSAYFKRSVQAKIADGRDIMERSIVQHAGGDIYGELSVDYEPYYLSSEATINREYDSNELLDESFGTSSGIFSKNSYEFSSVNSVSTTKPPKGAQ